MAVSYILTRCKLIVERDGTRHAWSIAGALERNILMYKGRSREEAVSVAKSRTHRSRKARTETLRFLALAGLMINQAQMVSGFRRWQ